MYKVAHIFKYYFGVTPSKSLIPLTGLPHKVPTPQPGTVAPRIQAFQSCFPLMAFLPLNIYQFQGNIFPLKRDLLFAQPGLDFHPNVILSLECSSPL